MDSGLWSSRDLTGAVIDALDSVIAVLDETGRIILVNEAWRAFARENGATPHTCQAVGENYFAACERALPDPGAQSALEGMRAVLAHRQPRFSLDYPCHCPQRQRWMRMSVTALAGPPTGLVISHREITARVQAVEALRESEVRYRTAFRASPDCDQHQSAGRWALSRRQRRVRAHDRLAPRRSRWADPWSNSGSGRIPRTASAWSDTLMREGTLREPRSAICDQGRESAHRPDVRPAGHPRRAALHAVDHARHHREETRWTRRCRTSERRFQDIVGASADWVWEIDATHRYYLCLRERERICSATRRQEVLGKTPSTSCRPRKRHGCAQVFADHCRPPGSRFETWTNVVLHRDGSIRHVQSSGVPIVSGIGQLLGYRGLDRDVTGTSPGGTDAARFRSEISPARRERNGLHLLDRAGRPSIVTFHRPARPSRAIARTSSWPTRASSPASSTRRTVRATWPICAQALQHR